MKILVGNFIFYAVQNQICICKLNTFVHVITLQETKPTHVVYLIVNEV